MLRYVNGFENVERVINIKEKMKEVVDCNKYFIKAIIS